MDKQKEIIPGWEAVEQLGSGGFSTVYKIKKTSGEYYAALKVIKIPASPEEYKNYLADGYDENTISQIFEKQVKKYEEEFHLMSLLKGNSNIVSYEDHMIVQGDDGKSWSIFIRMELLETLTNKCISSPPTLAETVKAGVDICRALELCARENIIHRDIKPQNIFVNRFGDYKLGDFGIARTMDHTTHATKIGTFTYIAPEVYRGEKYNADVDIYSLGLVLYWLLNERRLPFVPLPPAVPSPSDMSEAVAKRLKGDALPPPKNGSDNLKKIVLKACAFNGKDRYQSAAEMRMELERELYAINASGASTVTTDSTVKRGEIVTATETAKRGTAVNRDAKQGTGASVNPKQGTGINADAKQGRNINAKYSTAGNVTPKQGKTANANADATSKQGTAITKNASTGSTTSNDTTLIGLGKGDLAKQPDFSGDKTTPIASPLDLGNGGSGKTSTESKSTQDGKTNRKSVQGGKPTSGGKPISAGGASVSDSYKNSGEASANKTAISNKTSKNSGNGKKKKSKLLLILLVAILCAIAVGAFLSSNKNNDRNQDNSGVWESVEASVDASEGVLDGSVSVGDTIKFGSYEQDTNTSNGKEKIEWQVLEIKDGKALVISKYTLDCKQYNTSYTDVTWETCTLRKWLNNEFLNSAFSSEEKMLIPTVTVSADRNPYYSTYPGNATQDKVFLLSINEVKKYFSSNDERQCKPTACAEKNGAWTNSDGNCWWWLRSPGRYQISAAYVKYSGDVDESGDNVDYNDIAVRPALWINLES